MNKSEKWNINITGKNKKSVLFSQDTEADLTYELSSVINV